MSKSFEALAKRADDLNVTIEAEGQTLQGGSAGMLQQKLEELIKKHGANNVKVKVTIETP